MILALELSSRRASVAIRDGARVLAAETWDEPAARHQAVFEAIPRVMGAAGVTWTHLRALAVGRGPGSFSGVRVSLMAVQTLALPSQTPVIAVSSGEALAMDLADAAGAHAIVIAGDARRGAIWHAAFHRREQQVAQQMAWQLSPAADFAAQAPAGAWVVSPDWARLAAAIGPRDARLRWVEEDRYPTAQRVAELAGYHLQAGSPGEPAEPLYLHPPV